MAKKLYSSEFGLLKRRSNTFGRIKKKKVYSHLVKLNYVYISYWITIYEEYFRKNYWTQYKSEFLPDQELTSKSIVTPLNNPDINGSECNNKDFK